MTKPSALAKVGSVSENTVLSVGIVGAGEIVSRVHLPVLSACEGVRIVYVADRNRETATSVARSYKVAPFAVTDNVNELPETDVVLLAVPVTKRSPYYDLFAARGASVLAEKPLAAGVVEAERVCDLYPEYALACGFQRRTYASIMMAKLLVDENWLGGLRSISISEGALTTKTGTDSRFYDDAASGGGGVLMDLGCHSLDAAIYISDATEANVIDQRFVFDGSVDRELKATLTLQTPHGSVDLHYLVTWLRPATNTMELRFDNCIVEFSCGPSQDVQIHGVGNGGEVVSLAASSAKRAGADTTYQAFYLEWMDFLAAVRSRQPSKFSARTCLTTVRAIEALYQAGKHNPGMQNL